MFTLIYLNGEFNRPDTLVSFLQANVGKSPLLQVDCITPFPGTTDDLIKEVCNYLNKIDYGIEVIYNVTQNCSVEQNTEGFFVKYLVIQISIRVLFRL